MNTLRILFWLLIWILFLGLVNIKIIYKSGFKITLHSWRKNRGYLTKKSPKPID